jgi:cell pole-organizing protein PopZ
MAKETQIAFRADAETRAQLERAALDDGRTLSSLMLKIIRDWLARNRPEAVHHVVEKPAKRLAKTSARNRQVQGR